MLEYFIRAWSTMTVEKLRMIAVVFFALYLGIPFARLLVKAHREDKAAAAKAEEQARREQARAAKAAARAEEQARRERERAVKAAAPKRKRGRPRKAPVAEAEPVKAEPAPAVQPPKAAAPAEPVSAAQPVKPASAEAAAPVRMPSRAQGNRAFEGKRVAFTGKLPGMTRAEAIKAVNLNGGRAFQDMPLGINLLVVGDNPGMKKLDIADEKIDRIRKITAAQFFAMLTQPLDVTPVQFAALAAQMKEVSHV